MKEYKSKGRLVFNIINYIIIIFMMLSCLVPLIHILALSFSGASYTDSNMVTLIPKGFTLAAYKYVMQNSMFWRAFGVTITRLAVGVPLGLLLTILAAYPLSKEEQYFPARKIYMWLFMFVMIFNAGLVPTYLLIKDLKMMDTIWALVLPMGVNVFNIVLMMNFFRGIPREIEESALVDGAKQHTILWKLYLPLAKPSIATITLFTFMGHWNSWMDGRIYMNSTSNYPLQTYLQNVLQSSDQVLLNSNNMQSIIERMAVSGQNLRAAQLFISMIPLLIIYPFLQKYFTAGLVMGSVKG
ncbi:carbohydrate ABC transporter permease [Murimonas intestini]|uniref:Aldouronate transport system permease protein n=1 Tax=Murimonas intestini TaxID=1337051 RepID=A0AB73T357_9FIRM|nr:carbohydrate ABC transporter permease [Murimonas intestini]MCR1841552.1 carbohydrate ABC transporter permease [Murimonas intestini]MCR1867058.1 carbohydrate ABC transporter permease [Murimonas intestini]MCR1884081.1 carbohydrate ABC transporter permease [Murimonas intestini]